METTTFDKQSALERVQSIVREAQRIRDGINKDVIDYYYNSVPDSEEEDREIREGLRKYLIIAERQIHDLIDRRLGN